MTRARVTRVGLVCLTTAGLLVGGITPAFADGSGADGRTTPADRGGIAAGPDSGR
jgi:hypothetical protein